VLVFLIFAFFVIFCCFVGEGHEIRFWRLIPEVEADQLVKPEKIKRLIICSGQVYYALAEERKARKINDVAIVRLEQIAPFPADRVCFISCEKKMQK
jgi:2-oxoglutarate dehydrogenase complex dehydrogenase (E1) component-like enzyme